nr:CapA family protein [uncultured Butyrivibrio sp.]
MSKSRGSSNWNNKNNRIEKIDNSIVSKAIRVFLVTLFVVLGSGVLILCIIADRKGLLGGKPTKNTEKVNSLSPQWETIPEADKFYIAGNDAGKEPEEGTGGEKAIPEIPEEDKDYTHIIQTLDDNVVTIGFAGDILFDDNYAAGNAFKTHGNSAVGVIGDSLLGKMINADIMMVNNEFPYSYGGSPCEGKTFTFRARPDSAAILNTMGVDIVGLANNHAYDYGQQALIDTMSALDSVGVEYAGAGHNIDEASHTVYYVTESGMKIAIICATQIERLSNPDTKEATATSAGVFRCLDDTLLLERIREAREKNAYVIVYIHWGTESTSEIDYLQRDQAAEIADAGANLIIGNHPHVLQKIDYVNGVPVVYSLGNFMFNSKTLDSCLVLASLHSDGTVNLQFVPAIQSDCTVTEAIGGEAQRIIGYMNSMSSTAVIDGNGYISRR